MYRPFVLSLALSAVGATGVAADSAGQTTSSDVSTWRWHVSAILDAQRAPEGVGATQADAFAQRYQRYSVLGRLEAPQEDIQR